MNSIQRLFRSIRGRTNAKPKCILHIGAEKTGTTSIQGFLHVNRRALHRQGFHYMNFPGPINHWKLPVFCYTSTQLKEKGEQFSRAQGIENFSSYFASGFKSEWKKHAPKYPTFIISNEHLSGKLTGEKDVENLKAFLAPYFKEIEVIFYVRRQDALATSLYSTYLRAGGKRKEVLPKISRRNGLYFDFYEQAELFAKHFGQKHISVQLYPEKAINQKFDAVEDFCKIVGIDTVGLSRPKTQRNKALSAAAQLALLEFNNLGDSPTPVPKSSLERLEESIKGAPRRPTQKDAEHFLSQFTESNSKLKSSWLRKAAVEDMSIMPGEYPETEAQPNAEDTKKALETIYGAD